MMEDATQIESTSSNSQASVLSENFCSCNRFKDPHARFDFQRIINFEDHAMKLELDAMKLRHAKHEHGLTPKQIFCQFRVGLQCCCLFMVPCVMESYGLVLITGFFSVPQFKRHFQCFDSETNIDDCEINLEYQILVVLASMVGQQVGLYQNGYLVDRRGCKMTLLVACILMIAGTFVTVFSTSWLSFILGTLVCGVPWGMFQTLAVNYASDVCPTPIRAYVTSALSACCIIGQLFGSIIQAAFLNKTTHWAYTLPLSLQWFGPLPVLCLLWFLPESPWWLVRQGRYTDARKSLESLWSGRIRDCSIDDQLAFIICTDRDEKIKSGDKMGYLDCFKGIDRRRTVIACIVWGIQNASGQALMAFSTYFMRQAGVSTDLAFKLCIAQYTASIVATCKGWYLMSVCRRRTIYISGLAGIFFCLLMIGIFASLGKTKVISSQTSGIGAAIFLIGMSYIFSCTISLITSAIVAEIPSTRLKAKTVNLARSLYVAVGMINGGISPKLLNPKYSNIGAQSAWIFAGITLLCIIWSYFSLPETKRLNFDITDELFERKVAAREFRKEGVKTMGKQNANDQIQPTATKRSAKCSSEAEAQENA